MGSFGAVPGVKHLIPCLLAVVTPAFAQTGDCTKPFETKQASAGNISMTLRAGEIEVVGTKANALRITCNIGNRNDAARVKISFAAGRIRVQGGPDRDVNYRIEVPEKTGVVIRATAGDLRVKGLIEDKDIELRAGNLTIDVGDPGSYKVAEGNVLAGNISERPFGSAKDGLFRRFRKENRSGQYRLHAELLAGDLRLK